jgi:hypothetical protein
LKLELLKDAGLTDISATTVEIALDVPNGYEPLLGRLRSGALLARHAPRCGSG